MPRVASEASILHAPHPNPGARHRPAANESGEPSSSPFALLLDSADTPKAPEHGNRAGRTLSREATDPRPRPPESPDRPKNQRADASQNPSPETTDTQAAEDASADSVETADPVRKLECAKDETELCDALTAALGNADNADVTPPAPTSPPAAILPVSAEIEPPAQGGGDQAAAAGELTETAPAEAATPRIPLPEPPASNPGDQAEESVETAQLQPAEAAAVHAATKAMKAPPPSDGNDDDTDTRVTSNTQDATQAAPRTQKPEDGKQDAAAATAAPEAGKPRPPVDTPSAEAAETKIKADKPADAAESTEHPGHEPQHAHHTDTTKPGNTERQLLGAQVSEAARSANPPVEAIHAVLPPHDQAAASPLAQAAPAIVARATSDAAVPIAGLAVEIAARAQAGSNRFEIRLDPPELGRIDVRLDIDRNGQVTSRLIVERAETLEHLRRDAADLERALQQAGLKTSQDSLQFSLRNQDFASRDDNSSSNAARLVVPDPDLASPVEALVAGYGRMARPGGIDIRV